MEIKFENIRGRESAQPMYFYVTDFRCLLDRKKNSQT